MIITFLAFIFVLGLLVLVHEFGHFIAAKKLGVKVLEFAFGFPPRLLSTKKGETRYSFNAIPFGGYVKMLGELEESKHPRAYENQPPLNRFLISIAGVTMNVVLAWFILTIGFMVGMSPIVSDPNLLPGRKISSQIVIADIQKDSAAEKAGFKFGDILLGARSASDQINFSQANDVGNFNRAHLGQKIEYNYKRDDLTAMQSVNLSSNQDAPLGVAVVERAVIRVKWYQAPYVALHESWLVTKLTFALLAQFFHNLFFRGQVSEEVGGPVAVYFYSGLAVRAGLMVFAQFIAMLSLNLAIVNILPIPALDGGRILFVILEKIRGKKVVRENVENIIHTVGFVILIAIFIAITYRDIIKLF